MRLSGNLNWPSSCAISKLKCNDSWRTFGGIGTEVFEQRLGGPKVRIELQHAHRIGPGVIELAVSAKSVRKVHPDIAVPRSSSKGILPQSHCLDQVSGTGFEHT